MQAQLKWDDFTKYKQQMYENTATKNAPWVVLKGNEKDIARKEAMKYVLKHINYPGKGLTGADLSYDPKIVSVIDSKDKAKAINSGFTP
jgi:hypothetical protein